MAIYAASILKNAQPIISSAFQSGEFRLITPEVHQLFVSNANNAIPNYQELRTRADRALEVNYTLRTSRSVAGNAPTHSISGAVGDSAIITPTFTPYYDDFAVTLKGADNKILTQQDILMNELKNSFLNVVNGLETAAQTTLFSNRSTTNAVTTDGTFDATDDVFKITESTNGEQAMSITEMVMRLNGWSGMTVVADPVAYRKFRSQRANGTSNATNTAFQFDNVRVLLAPSFGASFAGLAGTYNKGAWIAVPNNTVAMLPWIDPQARQGIVEPGVGEYGSIINPIDGLTLGTFSYAERADGTASGGSVQDIVTQNQIGTYAAHMVAPISGSVGETPLQAFVLV